MAESKSSIEVTCHPEASESLHKLVENYNWLGKNYSKLVEKFGRLYYVAVHECKVVDHDKNRLELLKRLTNKFPEEEYESICIGEL